MCDRGISVASLYTERVRCDRVASLYTNERVMCDRGRSVASLYTNERVRCDREHHCTLMRESCVIEGYQ